MKQYIGTKTVKAEPMSMSEAYERKLLKEGVKPYECEKDKAGYLVEYEDGYQSWSPADVFEKAYRVAETPLDRMQIEHEEELNRQLQGKKFISSEQFSRLNYIAKVLLSAQNQTQHEYCSILYDRIKQMSNKRPILAHFDFGTAIKLLKAGGAIRRTGWDEGVFVVKQIPAHITGDIIPKMQSLPQIAKDILMARKDVRIDYTNQMLIIYPNGRADSWLPSSSDIFTNDWELVVK